jgi:hypothetical protein
MTLRQSLTVWWLVVAAMSLSSCNRHDGGIKSRGFTGTKVNGILEVDINPSDGGKCSVTINGEYDQAHPQVGTLHPHYFSASDKAHWISKNPDKTVAYNIVFKDDKSPFSDRVPPISSSLGNDPTSTISNANWLACVVGCNDSYPYDIQVNKQSCLISKDIGVIVQH